MFLFLVCMCVSCLILVWWRTYWGIDPDVYLEFNTLIWNWIVIWFVVWRVFFFHVVYAHFWLKEQVPYDYCHFNQGDRRLKRNFLRWNFIFTASKNARKSNAIFTRFSWILLRKSSLHRVTRCTTRIKKCGTILKHWTSNVKLDHNTTIRVRGVIPRKKFKISELPSLSCFFRGNVRLRVLSIHNDITRSTCIKRISLYTVSERSRRKFLSKQYKRFI